MGVESEPQATRTLSDLELRVVLGQHRAWVETNGREGTRANLSGFNLSDANLEGECLVAARMASAVLVGANLVGADLSGANLENADLTGAELNVAAMAGTRLAGANLTDAELHHADLTGSDVGRANLTRADLHYANLTAAELPHADLTDASLHRAVLDSANLTGAALRGADLSNADLRGTDLTNADLTRARLAFANLNRAKLNRAVLYRADLSHADLTAAHLCGADLGRTRLTGSRFENADLRSCRVHRMDKSYVRGAQFSPIAARWWVVVCELLFGPLSLWMARRGWPRAARAVRFKPEHNDSWSVLRQGYAGPRVLFLFFTVIVFALPYAAQSVMYTAVGPIERRAVAIAENRKKHIEARLAVAPDDPFLIEELERVNYALRHVERKPMWMVLVNWGSGNWWPATLAAMLILYNVGLYVLITSVSGLRDEEERSGWTPGWREYSYLVWIHRLVVLLFYVSFASFLINIAQMLREEVVIPKLM